MQQNTTPLQRAPRLEVKNVVVEVLDGPDEGARAEAESEMLSVGTALGNDLQLSDTTVSGFHLELTREGEGVAVKDLGSTNGTKIGDVLVERCIVPPGTTLAIGNTKLRVSDGVGAVVEVAADDELSELRGRTPIMRRLFAKVQRVARAQVPVLLIGESGTGKELVARSLHEHGGRPDGPFVTVDCGALAPNLVASALFGHERGAFTGAERQHIGAFERADGGTLFLDEIGELPSELQPQLLGALERRRFLRVGGRNELSVDVRVVCATNRDLRAEVNAGTFRMDLYYRIAVVVLRLPALRERVEDIPFLVEHFLRECGHDGPTSDVVTDDALAALGGYRWPGNVRELRNWVEATLAMGESPELFDFREGEADDGSPIAERVLHLPYKDARGTVLDDFEKTYLSRLMETAQNNVTRAAKQAQMDRSYLIKLLQRHGLR